jgi:DNA-binding NtrC family response regulator
MISYRAVKGAAVGEITHEATSMSEILLVDDDRKIRELLKIWLTGAGHTISEAPDAESGLAMLATKAFAVAMLDKDMPGHDGTWLVEQIQKGYPAVAMLLATGDDQIPPRVSLSRGIQGYLVKPFTRDAVLAAVSDAVAWHAVAAKQMAKTADADPIEAWLDHGPGGPPKIDS